MEDKLLVVIVGPTAVGKTALCVELAKLLETEIISADSRQFFKEMAIGTAKPTKEEMDGVPHHFVDCMSIEQEYSAGHFEIDALAKTRELFQDHEVVIATGGSTLYVSGLCEGFDDMPERRRSCGSRSLQIMKIRDWLFWWRSYRPMIPNMLRR